MHGNTAVLVLVVMAGLAFDFTNGFHDSANAMATSIATGALKPRLAVAVSAVLNLTGAFLSLSVAATIASGIVQQGDVTVVVVFGGLIGGILWNVITWYLGIPSSSSWALIGGVVGATLVASGGHAVVWSGLVSKVFIPMAFAPLIALVVAGVGTWLAYRFTSRIQPGVRNHGYRVGQIGSACMVSLAHGTNDAQKTMGILTLALIVNGTISSHASTPDWVIASCGVAIGAGTYFGGWRIIRTMGKGLTEIETPQGFAAEASSTAVILASTHFGIPLSTTQVCSGSVLGSGLAKRVPVRWNVFGRMVTTWIVTIPSAGAMGAGVYYAASEIGGTTGTVVMFLVGAVLCGGLFLLSRRNPVNPQNVNDDWAEKGAPAPAQQALAA